MINNPGSRRFLYGRLKLLLVTAVVVIGLTAFAIWLLLGFGVFKLRGEVRVFGGTLSYPDRLVLSTGGPCKGDQEVSLLRETDTDVQVKVVASSRPFFQGGPDCGGGIVEVQLSEPLGDRVVVYKHTGQWVSVHTFRPTGQQEEARESGTETQLTDEASQAHGAGDEDTARREVGVKGAELLSPDRLVLDAGTCKRNPEVSLLRETDVDVQVKMVVDPDPYPLGGPECLTAVIVQLQEPLGDRVVVDKHTGRLVSVTPVGVPDRSPQQVIDAPPPEGPPLQIDYPISDAELIDLQAVADQYGISLQEAIDQYAWRDNFSLAVSRIREAAPATFAGAEIVDGAHAWIAFTGPPPNAALDMIDIFTSGHSGVSVEVRTSQSVTEVELETAISAVHYAVFKAPGVRDANTSFESATRQIVTVVVLESTASDSVLDDLRAIAEKRLIDVTRPDILESISISVVHSKSPVLGGND